ncbi:hypothetical protein QJS04_geneDACA002739 [Acorus gramineus]|uniref:Uncharacterized protein n=1 Tax=Acorus gramineus TaxID=55184 RepID=A0AAV9BU89_ACOGR|nr:hypothetical protein QJS04_geneDACA002739 [Acorus gramineus]
MPSINWREAADNWFGTCCCSFGGISEKLVSGYVNSYACAEGKCLVDETSVIICKDDFEGCGFPDFADVRPKHDSKPDHLPKDDLIYNLRDSGACPGGKSLENGKEGMGEVSKSVVFLSPERDESITDQEGHVNEGLTVSNSLCCSSPGFPHLSGCGKVSVLETPDMPRPSLDGTQADGVDSLALSSNSNSKNPAKSFLCSPAHVSSSVEQFQCYRDTKEHHLSDVHDSPLHAMSTTSSEGQQSMKNPMHTNIDGPLRNGFLGSGFMIRTSSFSSDVKWVEFRCRNCSSVIGSYPSVNGIDAPVDNGIRLFKCYVSTSLPIGGPQDIFRKHSLQRVFLHLLLESATDEISFRTLVRNLRTNSPMLQIILLNQKMWRATGHCSENEVVGLARGVNLKSVAKVLFCDCSVATETDLRVIEDWSKKNQVDEVYMLTSQIEELIDNLKREQTVLPRSYAVIQGFLLSSLDR